MGDCTRLAWALAGALWLFSCTRGGHGDELTVRYVSLGNRAGYLQLVLDRGKWINGAGHEGRTALQRGYVRVYRVGAEDDRVIFADVSVSTMTLAGERVTPGRLVRHLTSIVVPAEERVFDGGGVGVEVHMEKEIYYICLWNPQSLPKKYRGAKGVRMLLQLESATFPP